MARKTSNTLAQVPLTRLWTVSGDEFGIGVCRVAGVEAIDVGAQDKQVCLQLNRKQRRQTVIVPETPLRSPLITLSTQRSLNPINGRTPSLVVTRGQNNAMLLFT